MTKPTLEAMYICNGKIKEEEYFMKKIYILVLLLISISLLNVFLSAEEKLYMGIDIQKKEREEKITSILNHLDENDIDKKEDALKRAKAYIDDERIQKKLVGLYIEEQNKYLEMMRKFKKDITLEEEKKYKEYFVYYRNLERLVLEKIKLDEKLRIKLLVSSPSWDENIVYQIKKAGVKALDDLIERLYKEKYNYSIVNGIVCILSDILMTNEISSEKREKIKIRLLEMIKQKEPDARVAGAKGLGNFVEDKGIINVLKPLLNDPYKGKILKGSMEEKQYWEEFYPVREAAQESIRKIEKNSIK
jgi:hypothetical protein